MTLALKANPNVLECLYTPLVDMHRRWRAPDSDYDLRGMHVLPIPESIGLDSGRETIEFSGIRGRIEIDLVTHDVRKFFLLMLKKNGYVLEQLFSPLIVRTHATARGTEGDRQSLRHPPSRAPLPGFCRNAVEAF